MKQHPRLTVLSAIILTASLLVVSNSFASKHHKNYKGEYQNYKGEVPIVASPCPPDNGLKDGIYLGLGAGYNAYRERQNIGLTDDDGDTLTANPVQHIGGFQGSIFGGYGQYFDWFYIAGEVFYNYSGANSKFAIEGYNSSFTIRSSYGGAILPGVRVNENSLIYARVGYNRTFFKATESGDEGPNLNTSTWLGGINYGLGMETAIYDNFSVRGEYTYTSFNSFSSAIATRFSPSDSQFVLGLIYHFDCL